MERLQTMDRATYDRLRVLSTELRRLMQRGPVGAPALCDREADVEVVLSANRRLRGVRLGAVLARV